LILIKNFKNLVKMATIEENIEASFVKMMAENDSTGFKHYIENLPYSSINKLKERNFLKN